MFHKIKYIFYSFRRFLFLRGDPCRIRDGGDVLPRLHGPQPGHPHRPGHQPQGHPRQLLLGHEDLRGRHRLQARRRRRRRGLDQGRRREADREVRHPPGPRQGEGRGRAAGRRYPATRSAGRSPCPRTSRRRRPASSRSRWATS
ncbi:MAG: hypothetical protein M0C28_01950 [Candidatus Moduliflexus flocculans]|nr:hypothetical protein [Candidatus Moduliflexus flocculans]